MTVMVIILWEKVRMVNTFVQVASKCSNPLNRVNGAMSQILVTWKIATGRDVMSARGRWDGTPMNENRKSQGESRGQVYLFAVDDRFFVL